MWIQEFSTLKSETWMYMCLLYWKCSLNCAERSWFHYKLFQKVLNPKCSCSHVRNVALLITWSLCPLNKMYFLYLLQKECRLWLCELCLAQYRESTPGAKQHCINHGDIVLQHNDSDCVTKMIPWQLLHLLLFNTNPFVFIVFKPAIKPAQPLEARVAGMQWCTSSF